MWVKTLKSTVSLQELQAVMNLLLISMLRTKLRYSGRPASSNQLLAHLSCSFSFSFHVHSTRQYEIQPFICISEPTCHAVISYEQCDPFAVPSLWEGAPMVAGADIKSPHGT